MLYKCNYCDPVTKRGEKPIKSVDTDLHEFIKDEKNKYYHLDCYREHLIKRKKMTNVDEINEIISSLQEETKDFITESFQKDTFLKWIMDFYDGSLPSYYLKKLKSVREGTHESINEPVNYETLLDIYTYMENYLRRRAATMKIANVAQRMNYDLAVVVGNYGDYKKFKQKQKGFSAEKNEVDRQIKVGNKLKAKTEELAYQNKEKDFDIADIMDELLL